MQHCISVNIEYERESDEYKQYIHTRILSPVEEEKIDADMEIEISENKFEKLTEVVSSNSVYWHTHAVHNTSVLVSETQRIGKMVLWDAGTGQKEREVDNPGHIWYADFCGESKRCLIASSDDRNKKVPIIKYWDQLDSDQIIKPKCIKTQDLVGLKIIRQKPMVVQSNGCTMNMFSASISEIKFPTSINFFDYDVKQSTLWGGKSDSASTRLIMVDLETTKTLDFEIKEPFTHLVLSKSTPSVVLYNENARTIVRHDSRAKLSGSKSETLSFLVAENDRYPDRHDYRHEISTLDVDPDDTKIWYSFCGRIYCIDTRIEKSQLMVEDRFGWLSQFKIDHSNRRMLIDNGASFCGDESYSLDVYSI